MYFFLRLSRKIPYVLAKNFKVGNNTEKLYLKAAEISLSTLYLHIVTRSSWRMQEVLDLISISASDLLSLSRSNYGR